MIRNRRLFAAAAILAAPLISGRAQSQGLDLTVNDVGVGIGNVPKVYGIRLNFRDTDDFDVRGINVTIWQPDAEPRGTVTGIALGIPMTGAARITGLAAGIFGVSATERITGVGIGGLGLGAGGRLDGIMIGGIGVGSGGSVHGLTLGGIGVGAGGALRGVTVGGIGVGSGAELSGLAIGGIGVGAGGSANGILIGGIGVGTGGSLSGLSFGGVGVGAGGDVTGLTVAGIGVGSGGTLRWVSIAGVGVGAPRIEGVAIAAAVGAQDAKALIIAPAYMRIDRGTFTGVSASAFNHVKGSQHGLTIGVFNYAQQLHGLQLGVLNYVRDNPRAFRLLPVVNVGR
ncbi:MAG: hypothetical protein ACJ79K_06900 [Gemmatimonadaceae bacterium]